MTGRFAILGAGRLGRTLGRLLLESGGAPGGLSCRSLASARQAARIVGGGEPTTSNARAARDCDLVLICTPDGAIASVAGDLAAARLRLRRVVVAHTSGALSSAILAPLRAAGARVASMHPLASVADPRDARRRMLGTPWAVEGDAGALRVVRPIVQEIGGVPVSIPAGAKALYHLIACLLSNDLVAFLAAGFEAAEGLGLTARDAARLYLPLVRGTVENVARLGAARALTGPVSRGDLATLRLHGEVLRSLPADVRRLHRILALRAVALALQAQTITPDQAAKVARLVGGQP